LAPLTAQLGPSKKVRIEVRKPRSGWVDAN
jgi:hypothetical protein